MTERAPGEVGGLHLSDPPGRKQAAPVDPDESADVGQGAIGGRLAKTRRIVDLFSEHPSQPDSPSSSRAPAER
jgi:hypothetical protein